MIWRLSSSIHQFHKKWGRAKVRQESVAKGARTRPTSDVGRRFFLLLIWCPSGHPNLSPPLSGVWALQLRDGGLAITIDGGAADGVAQSILVLLGNSVSISDMNHGSGGDPHRKNSPCRPRACRRPEGIRTPNTQRCRRAQSLRQSVLHTAGQR